MIIFLHNIFADVQLEELSKQSNPLDSPEPDEGVSDLCAGLAAPGGPGLVVPLPA